MINNDTLFEICKYLENNDIINTHLAFNIPMQLNIIRLLDKYYECGTCHKYEKVLYKCIMCQIDNCLYCSVICKKCNGFKCNMFLCGNSNIESDVDNIGSSEEHDKDDNNNKNTCNHNFESTINKYNCRNHNTKCNFCNKESACECKGGNKCRNCLWLLCKYCGKYGICEECDGFDN